MILSADEIRLAWAETEELARSEDGMERMCAESFVDYESVAQQITEISADCAVALVNAKQVHHAGLHETATLMATSIKFGLLIADRAALRRNRAEK